MDTIRYCAVCGKETKDDKLSRFGEFFCSPKHLDEFVEETKKQKLGQSTDLNRGTEPVTITAKDPVTVAGNDFFSLLNNTRDILFKEKYAKIFAVSFSVLLIVFAFLGGLFYIPVVDIGFFRMSEVTLFDYAFILLSSVLSAILLALIWFNRDQQLHLGRAGTASAGLAGFMAAVCPTCQAVNFVALGATAISIPLGPIIPYLGALKFFSLGLLGLATYTTSKSIYSKTCPTTVIPLNQPHRKESKEENSPIVQFFFENNMGFSLLTGLIVILLFNQIMLMSVFASMVPTPGTAASMIGKVSIQGSELAYGSKITLKPMPLATEEQPVIAGYKTKVKALPTISEMTMAPSTGDTAQDLVNNVVPHGTPSYGQEAGVSFDDPIQAQNVWGTYEGSIQLSADMQTRWGKIVNAFTCDYCCGSPQNPTIITRCGCAHAKAARGMAKWFIQKYGSQYSDEEIYGEMARWYALWYPGPTVKRIAEELQANGGRF